MKKYCVDLHGGLWFQYNTKDATWYASPCCLYNQRYPVKENINLEFWQHSDIQSTRQANLNGEELPNACATCKVTEDNGNVSRRMAFNERLGTSWQSSESVIALDLQSDFSCNLACRICGPHYSTLWRQIDPQQYKIDNKFKVRANNNSVLTLLETIPFHDIKQIHFQGGEPLLTNTHIQILEKLQNYTDVSQVTLWYHSNGTQKVSNSILKFWEKFKMLEIYFSLDDLGPRMEYQRWPLEWGQVHENMLWWKENLPHNGLLRIERTVGVLTAYWVDELDQWHQQYFSHSKYGDPITMNYHTCVNDFSLGATSDLYQQAVLNKFSPDHWIHKTFKSLTKESPDKIDSMFKCLNRQDQLRNQNWKSVYPEFLEWYPNYAN